MNALIDLRTNIAGTLSPTPAARRDVQIQLAAQNSSLKTMAASQLKMEEESTPPTQFETDLDRNAFLQLLVLELQNQDPLQPMDNREMVTQLAQFTSLEQMQNLNDSFEILSGNVDQLNFISANSLVGHDVVAINEAGELVEGTVNGVQLNGSIVLLRLDTGTVPMTSVLEISAAGPPSDEPASKK